MSEQTTTWRDDASGPSIEDAPTEVLPALVAPAVFLDPDAASPAADEVTTAGDAAPAAGTGPGGPTPAVAEAQAAGGEADWSADTGTQPTPDVPLAHRAAAPRLEPLPSGEYAALPATSTTLADPSVAAPETLAELAEEPVGDLWAEPLPEDDVRTLRTLLFGNEPRGYDERLAAIEQRLDALARSPMQAQPQTEEAARLAAMEQRLDALARQLDETHGAARAGDVTLHSLAELQRQIQDLRLDHAHATMDLTAQVRQADDRCRLRQRRARASARLELLQLRRRVYAHATGQVAYSRSTLRSTGRSVGAPNEPAGTPPIWPAAQGAGARNVNATVRPGGEMDTATAWRAVRLTTVAMVRALFALIVVLAHLAVEDVRAASQHLAELFHRH